MENIDTRNQLIGIVKNSAQVDAKGVPQGKLDAILAMVKNQMNPDQPISTLESVLEQTADFVKGVGKDVKDLGAAAGEAVKDIASGVKQAAQDVVANPNLIKDTWEITWDNAYEGTEKVGNVIKEIVDDPLLIKDLWDVTKEKITGEVDRVTNEVAAAVKDVANDPSILWDTTKGSWNDLQDGDKVEQAIRNGVPGGASLLDAATSKTSKPITERLYNGLKGAAELALAADGVESALEMGGKLAGRVIGEAAEATAGATKLVGAGVKAGERAAAEEIAVGVKTGERTVAEEVGAGVKAGEKTAAEEAGAGVKGGRRAGERD